MLATVARAASHSPTGRAPFFFFAFAVVLASWLGGFRPGLLAGILATVSATWSLVAYDGANLSNPRALVLPGLFFLLCLLITTIIGRMHDVNQQLRTTQRELLAANQKLRELNEDLECFAHAASHDLQEPLRMVASYSQLLVRENKGRLDPQSEKFVEYIEDGVIRMRALVDDILALSRLNADSGGPAAGRTDSGESLRSALRLLDVAIRDSGAEITAGDMPVVCVDSGRLTQVFQNLIGNAIKYRGEAPPRISVSGCRDGGFCTFSVQDNGIGVDAEHHQQIFDIFRRLHTADQYPGMGIGLAISKRIVEKSGGRMWVESVRGSGATFRFTLPAPSAEQAASAG